MCLFPIEFTLPLRIHIYTLFVNSGVCYSWKTLQQKKVFVPIQCEIKNSLRACVSINMSKKSNFRTGSLATVFLCDMYKAKSRNSNFWQTLNLLTGAEWRTNQINDVDEWVETVVEKREYDRILEENEVQPDSEICDEYTNKSLTKEVNRKELFKTLDAHNVKCTYVFTTFFFKIHYNS